MTYIYIYTYAKINKLKESEFFLTCTLTVAVLQPPFLCGCGCRTRGGAVTSRSVRSSDGLSLAEGACRCRLAQLDGVVGLRCEDASSSVSHSFHAVPEERAGRAVRVGQHQHVLHVLVEDVAPANT